MLSWFRGKSFEEQVSEFDDKINIVVNSLVKSSKSSAEDDQFDLANLQNLDTCNEYVIFLGAELEKRFKKIDAEAIADAIYIGKRRKNSQKKEMNNMNANNYENDNQVKHSKKEICIKISSHYVRILNLLSAILTAINPDLNMCSRRIKALYETTSSDVNTGFVKTCVSDDTDKSNPLYTKNIKNIPGIKQLLNLYYFNLIQDANNIDPEELEKIKEEFKKILQTFTEVFKFSIDENPLEPIEISEVDESITQLNQAVAENHPAEPLEPLLQEKVNQMNASLQTLKEQIEQKTAIPNETVNKIKNNIRNSIQTEFKQNFDALKTQLDTLINEIKNKPPTPVTSNQNMSNQPIGGPVQNTYVPTEQPNNTIITANTINTPNPETTPQTGGVYNNQPIANVTTPTTTNNTNLTIPNNTNNINNNKLLENVTTTTDPNISNTPNSINIIPEEIAPVDLKLAKTNIGKFLEFADKYKSYYEIPEEYKVAFETNDINEIVDFYTCSSQPSQVVINIDDSKYSDFKNSYQALKKHYLDSSNKLLSIIENDLLEKVEPSNNNNNNKKTKNNGNNNLKEQYKLRSITNQQLNKIQISVMQELSNYYSKCQKYYEEAFKYLADSLIPEELY
jgi:hypothetical protein